jgi:hypothetical protein
VLADTAIQTAGFVLVGIATLSAIIGSVWALSRTHGAKDSIEILAGANEELRKVNTDLQVQITANEQKFNLKLLDQDRECQKQLATLTGKVETLTNGLGRQIALAVITEIRNDRGSNGTSSSP